MRRSRFITALLGDKWALACLLALVLLVFLGLFCPWIAPNDPLETHIKTKFARISPLYPLGTDHLGRCVFSRLLYGIRTSLGLSALTMLLTVGVGCGIGMVAGMLRGRADAFIMRVCDVFMSFPSEVVLLAVVGFLGPDMINMVAAMVVAKWAWYARMARSAAVGVADEFYVRYAKAAGAGKARILRTHILPVVAGDLAVLATLDTGAVVLGISTLSFLGLGVQPPTPEWGMMLSEAKNVLAVRPELMLPAGLTILLVVACCNYLGDSLRDALDSRRPSAAREA